MLQALTLYSFRKVFFVAILFASAFFGTFYFMSKPNGSDTEVMISAALSLVLGILALFFYTVQNRTIATSYIEKNFDGDEYSVGEVMGETGGYAIHVFLLVLTFGLAYNILIPFVGSVLGGPFQVSVAGFDFNALTLAINYFFVIWLFIGTAQVVVMDMTFFETLSATLQFVFNNFLRMFGFALFILVIHLLFQMTLLSTYQLDPLTTMPIKILVFAYLMALCNSYAVSFFASGNDDREDDDEDEDDEDDEDDE